MTNPIDGAKRNLNLFTQKLSDTNQRIATGNRINKAADDAAGLAIALQLATDTSQLKVASRNIADGVSFSDIKESVLTSLGDIGVRLSELSAQSANGTLSDTQRSALQQEFSQLTQEANRIVQATKFNGQQVLGQSVSIQIGTDGTQNSQLNLVDPNVAENVALLAPLNINSQVTAQEALTQVQSFIQSVGTARGELGAQTSRLSSASNTVQNQAIANQEAESRIRSADIAKEVSDGVSLQIRQNSSLAILAQAGKLNATIVSSLLR